jgi:hypothetical protein
VAQTPKVDLLTQNLPSPQYKDKIQIDKPMNRGIIDLEEDGRYVCGQPLSSSFRNL